MNMTDRNIDQYICRQYDDFYYYRIYDLEQDNWVDEWRAPEDTKWEYHPREEGSQIIIRKEDAALRAKMEKDFVQWLKDNDIDPWDL